MSGSLKIGGSELINDAGGSGSLNWGAGTPAGTVLQVITNTDNTEYGLTVGTTPENYTELNTSITLKKANSKVLVCFNFGAVICGNGNLGYAKTQFKIGSGSNSDLTPLGLNNVGGSRKHHMAVNILDQTYQSDNGASMTLEHTTSSPEGTILTYASWFWAESSSGTLYINRNARDGGTDFSGVSSCTLMEIAT